MKITLDIPDSARAVFVNLLYQRKDGLVMCAGQIDTNELQDGAFFELHDRAGAEAENVEHHCD